MFFVLSKIFYFLILPFSWIVILLLYSFVTRSNRIRRSLIRSSAILLIIFSNPWISNISLGLLETKPLNILKPTDIGIVLTGITETGINVSNQTQLSEGADRLTEAIRLLNEGYIRRILISGGAADIHHPNQNEGLELYRLAISLGVNPENIIHENRSRNTYENALYSKSHLAQYNEVPLLITSAFHMPRAFACFKKQGIAVTRYPVDYRSSSKFQWDYLVPSVPALQNWNIIAKELTGSIVYRAMGYI